MIAHNYIIHAHVISTNPVPKLENNLVEAYLNKVSEDLYLNIWCKIGFKLVLGVRQCIT